MGHHEAQSFGATSALSSTPLWHNMNGDAEHHKSDGIHAGRASLSRTDERAPKQARMSASPPSRTANAAATDHVKADSSLHHAPPDHHQHAYIEHQQQNLHNHQAHLDHLHDAPPAPMHHPFPHEWPPPPPPSAASTDAFHRNTTNGAPDYTYTHAQHQPQDPASTSHVQAWPWPPEHHAPAAGGSHSGDFIDHGYMPAQHSRPTEPWATAVTSAAHSSGLFASSAIFNHSPSPAYHLANGLPRPGSGNSSDYASQHHAYSAGGHASLSSHLAPRGYSLDMTLGQPSPTPLHFPSHMSSNGAGQQNMAVPQRALSLPGQTDALAAYTSQHVQAGGPSRPLFSYSAITSAPTSMLPPSSVNHHAWSNSSGSPTGTSPRTPVSTMSTSGYCPPGTSATVAMAASANRARRAQEKAQNPSPPPTSSSNPAVAAAAAVKRTQPVKKPAARPAIELEFDCRFCSKKLAKLTLRGPGTFTSGRHEGVYYCLNCVPLPHTQKSTSINSLDEEATYADTLSATVDRLEGLSVEEADPRPPPANRTSANGGVSSKKRTKMEDDVLACDVCRRDVGTGGLRLVGAAEGENPEVTIEVLCAHCETRYLRCSDCGGGGGNRGVGRWRAKEMFPEGRRTCRLSHVRIGTLNDMTYDVWPITTIPRAQLPKLIEMCRELYTTTLYATLAVPDMMESQGALARSFEEVEKQAMDSWCMFEPLMTDDVEATHQSRRYVALRWSTPTSRKGKKPRNGAGDDCSDDPSQPVPLIRQGKVLAGFILAEWDLNIGSLHVALTMPTGSGESYDAASRLMQTLFRHVRNDVASVNYAREQQGAPPLPNLKQAWSLHMIKRDSRIMSRIESRRGFVPLDDYLTKYPDANRSDFAPIRPVFLPPELLRGWFVFVKRVEDSDDDNWLNVAQQKFPQPVTTA
ncbi:hypothetical protein OIV83_004200 [Microbotryomycetes sp. JL201]|nr:hypothetical protein OIV83_004200 [Microbotryomycetes sp. JL201]